MKTLIFSILLISSLLMMSCADFLDEESKMTKTEELVYSNPAAIESLVAACYSYTRIWYGHEMAIYLSMGGTDMWYPGKDGLWSPAGELTTYNGLKADMVSYDQMWEAFYYAINTCNTALKVLEDPEKDFFEEETKLHLLSEVRFLRAFYYWHLVELFGPVQINLTPAERPSTLFTRHSIDEVYAQMLEDVGFAIESLPEDEEPSSRVTWLTAKSFRARLNLYYGSEYYADKVSYLGQNRAYYNAQAAQDAKDVIAGAEALGKHLYDDAADIWKMENEMTVDNAEYIWAIDFYNTIDGTTKWSEIPYRLNEEAQWDKSYTRADGAGQGCVQHLFWTPIWNNQSTDVGGPSITDVLVRISGAAEMFTQASPSEKVPVNLGQFYVKYAMGYTRFGPTKYCLDLFDETMDERFDATFRTAWYKHPDVVPENWPDPATCAYPLMSVGTQTDTCLFFSKRPLTDKQIAWATGRYKAMDVTIQFDEDDMPTTGTVDEGAVMYPAMRKFEDTASELGDMAIFNDYFSKRDFPVFRLAEMYLIAAEAQIESNQSDALDHFNALRRKRAFPGKEADMEVSAVTIDNILEERGREFCAEDIRWFDLKRTKKLEQQVAKNPRIAPFFESNKHYLRPIPAIQISSSENFEEEGLQNPGY